jgi:hypothetical protein
MAAVMEPSWPGKSTLAPVRAATPRNLSAQKSPLCGRSAPPTSRDAAIHTRQGSICGETGSAMAGNPGIPGNEHRVIFVAAAGSGGRPHSNDETRLPASSRLIRRVTQ